jgi:hypothetical protein
LVRELFVYCTGVTNGSNVRFVTPVDYLPGTLKPFVNGQLVNEQARVELPPRDFDLEFPPEPGDSVAAFVREA